MLLSLNKCSRRVFRSQVYYIAVKKKKRIAFLRPGDPLTDTVNTLIEVGVRAVLHASRITPEREIRPMYYRLS